MSDKQTRCGFIAVLGLTNVGKSTLLNQLVGQKVSIVSRKVQTTRFRVLGITVHKQSQLVFMDTPGIFEASEKFDRAMVKSAWQAQEEADVTLFIMDATHGLSSDNEAILSKLHFDQKPIVLIINKVDLVPKDQLLPLLAQMHESYNFKQIFLISALSGDGCGDVMDYLSDHVPQGPYLFPEDQMTDLPMRLLAAEITREAIYTFLHKELPYAIHVETESWEDFDNGDVRIAQVIFVSRDSQKGIVLGHKGEMIKRLGQVSRHELTKVLDRKVHLSLTVRVDEKWRMRQGIYERLGLDMNA